MPSITVRNVPDEVRRAIRVRAARHGHSAEAEIRDILEAAVKPRSRVTLGSLLAQIGRDAKLTDEEFHILANVRDRAPVRAATFE